MEKFRSLLDVAGLVLLIVAASLVSVPVGVAVAGVAVLAVSWRIG